MVCICANMYRYVIFVCVRVLVNPFVNVYVCVRLCISICSFICHLFLFASLISPLCLSLVSPFCLYICASMFFCISMCMCRCMCMYVYVFMCVCMCRSMYVSISMDTTQRPKKKRREDEREKRRGKSSDKRRDEERQRWREMNEKRNERREIERDITNSKPGSARINLDLFPRTEVMCTINAVIKKPAGGKFTCFLMQLASGPRVGPQETSGVTVKPSWTLPWKNTRASGHPKLRNAAHTHSEGCSWFQIAPTGQI